MRLRYLPDAAVEQALRSIERIRPMKEPPGKLNVAFIVIALSIGWTAIAEAQAPIRIGASLSKTGT